jgi:hypothetical protein
MPANFTGVTAFMLSTRNPLGSQDQHLLDELA